MDIKLVMPILEDAQLSLETLGKTQDVFRQLLTEFLEAANKPEASYEIRLPAEGVYHLMQPMFDLLGEAASNLRTVIGVCQQMSEPQPGAEAGTLALVASA